MAKQELLGEVKKLITIGKEKGFLTYDELNNTLPAEVVSSDQFGSIMTMFGELDIEIVDAPDGERTQKRTERGEAADDADDAERRLLDRHAQRGRDLRADGFPRGGDVEAHAARLLAFELQRGHYKDQSSDSFWCRDDDFTVPVGQDYNMGSSSVDHLLPRQGLRYWS